MEVDFKFELDEIKLFKHAFNRGILIDLCVALNKEEGNHSILIGNKISDLIIKASLRGLL